jgi:ABC-type phosphate transport system substrate-binding protein
MHSFLNMPVKLNDIAPTLKRIFNMFKEKKFVMKNISLSFLLLTGLFFGACKGGKGQTVADTGKMKSFGNNSNSNILVGAGSTLIYPLFSKLFTGYVRETHVMVNYQSVGSAGGILQLMDKTVDFGDLDAPLRDEQIKKMGAPVLQITLFRRLLTQSGSNDNSEDGFNWAIIYKEQNYDGRSLMHAQKLLKMLWWDVHEGQKYCSGSGYAPLSPTEVAAAENILKSATFNGKPIL